MEKALKMIKESDFSLDVALYALKEQGSDRALAIREKVIEYTEPNRVVKIREKFSLHAKNKCVVSKSKRPIFDMELMRKLYNQQVVRWACDFMTSTLDINEWEYVDRFLSFCVVDAIVKTPKSVLAEKIKEANSHLRSQGFDYDVFSFETNSECEILVRLDAYYKPGVSAELWDKLCDKEFYDNDAVAFVQSQGMNKWLYVGKM